LGEPQGVAQRTDGGRGLPVALRASRRPYGKLAVPGRAAALLGGPRAARRDPRAAPPARAGAPDPRRPAARRARRGAPRRAAGGVERQVLLLPLGRAARRPPALGVARRR